MKNLDTFLNLQNRKIVIVEDDASNFRYLETVLKKADAEVIWIRNGRDAINYCTDKGNDIDLVIMDILIPLVTGIDAIREIKKVRKKLAVVAVTAYISPDIQEKCYLAGCDEFLYKPFFPKQLTDSIRPFFAKEKTKVFN